MTDWQLEVDLKKLTADMLNVCCIQLTVQEVSNLQVCNCKTLKTLPKTLHLWMMLHLELERELIVIIRIRLDIHFITK